MRMPMLLLLATLLPLHVFAQDSDDGRDAKIARLEQTVELLNRRLQALEAERDAAMAALPGSRTAEVPAVALQGAPPAAESIAAPPPAAHAIFDVCG